MSSDIQPNPLTESSMTIPSDSEQYSGNDDISASPPSSSSPPPMILYTPPTLWGLLRGAAINLLLPFVNGLMLGFGELFAHEAAFRLGWGGTKESINMIPSKSLRWSGQTVGIGRRRLENFSVRRVAKTSPLLSKSSPTVLRANTRSKFAKTSNLIRSGAGIRFASTSPPAVATTATSPEPASAVSSTATTTPEITTSSLDNAIDFTSDSLYNIPEHIGYLKSLGLDYGWGPTTGMEWLLEHVHIFAGTPWWASITITAILVRLVLFKPYVDAAVNGAKMQAVMPITKPLTKEMADAMRAGDNMRAQQLRQELSLINQRAGIKLWKSFVPALQMFAGYGTFVLLRGMAHLPVPGFADGGILWFSNLAVADPFFILPVATAGVLHWVLRRGGETGATTMSPEAMKLMMYGLPAMTLLFTWWLPAALQLSFFISGLLSFGQASLFKLPGFRSYWNMPPLPSGAAAVTPDGRPPTPYKGMMKVRTPLSTAELNSAFQEGRKQSMLQKVSKQLRDNTSEIRTAATTMMSKTQGTLDGRRVKRDKEARDAYEKKRKAEIAAEMEEIAEAKRMRKQARERDSLHNVD
ncbi:Oxidase assembly 1 [Hyphodiscus hymeniophilus]|uniref:Oxidase assembly 1 n=1 Tax=Hyphodiscus hymeniophilus TaxID=353542 RepID=A0A9P7AU78_9HELO|nr:Oxidase assembly 1 [Hyphodiscus hymeniophilus]